jgi:ribosomal protein S18 acetylase RimI-like enzyme
MFRYAGQAGGGPLMSNVRPQKNMRVALLTALNAQQYRQLMLLAYEYAADAFTSTAAERAAEPESWWLNRIANPSGLKVAFGAFEGNTLVGTVALEFSSKPKIKHKALLIGMYVSAESRRRGIGKALLQAAVEHAQARAGVLVLALTVTEGNNAAVKLYQAAGFEAFGTEPMAIRTFSGFKSKIHMWRNIASENTAA